jgi:NitT/TauT family transport system substrate-binding protein
MRIVRRLLVPAFALALCAGMSPFPPLRAAEPATVRIGVLNIASDAPFIIADRKGYFKDEGIDPVFTTFASSGNMIVPLSTGQLDVGGGAASVGVYNGVAHGINVRIVADRGSDPPGYGFDPLLVRKDLVTSGRFKTPRDLKGMTVAGNQPGSASSSTLNELLLKYGLTFADIKRVNLDYPAHVAAFANAKIDAAITSEPDATAAEKLGVAVRVMGSDAWYPRQQLSVVIYGGDFAKNRHDVGVHFMRAYIKAARYYYGALAGGHLAGPNAADVIAILSAATSIKDPAVYRAITPSSVDPDGRLNLASMRKDLQFFKNQGLIEGKVEVEDVIDTSFVDEAIKGLRPYRRR